MFSCLPALIWTSFIFIAEATKTFTKFVVDNIALIPENIWIAFDNLPSAMKGWLQKWLKLVWDFIDKITWGLGWKIWEALWLNKILDSWLWSDTKKSFKFVWISSKDFALTQKWIQAIIKEYDNSHFDYVLDEVDRNNVADKTKLFYGKYEWEKMSDESKNELLNEIEITFQEQLQKRRVGGYYLPKPRVDEIIKKFLIQEYKVSKEQADNYIILLLLMLTRRVKIIY